jgi:Flp pilus assembly protein TadG
MIEDTMHRYASFKWLSRRRSDRRGVTTLEFAIVAVLFIGMLVSILELGFDFVLREDLDSALHQAARQLQTGNAQNVTNGSTFINNYLCPNGYGLFTCSSLYIKVQQISPSSTQDYYNFTTGLPPTNAGSLDLTAYSSASFCNAGPSELLLISAIYVRPSWVPNFFPGALPSMMSMKSGGAQVQVTFASVGLVSEGYALSPSGTNSAPSC